MEINVNRQHIFEAIKELQVVDKLPRPALQEFCRVFKVNDGGAENGGIGKAFENKIADIICQEGQGFSDYLKLPKFRSMGHQLNQKLNNVFQKVWEELPAISNRQQISQLKKQLDELTPTFQNTADSASFHLKLLQIYRTSPLNPANTNTNKPPKKDVKPKPQPNLNQVPFSNNSANIQNTPGLINPQQQPNLFQYFPFPPPAYPKVQAQEEETYIMNNKPHPQLFQMSRFALQQPFGQQLYDFPPIDPKHIFPLKKEENRRNLTQNLYTQDHLSNMILKFKQYEFINCVCEGKLELQEQNNFSCSACSFSYHYSCLKTTNPNNEELLCPICKLSRDTIFCQVVKDPIKISWFVQEKQDKDLKVELSLEESEQVHEARKKGFNCQIRFLKLDGKKKQLNPSDSFTSEAGILNKSSKHSQSEITLPQLCQDKKQPISLQIMLRSDQDKQKEQSSKLFFFGVFLVNIRNTNLIVQELFKSSNSFPFEYYSSFMDEKGKVQVSLTSQGFSSINIKYPVRGSNCKHAGFFDLKNFLQLLIDLKKDKESEILCPICSQACPSFLYDSFVTNCIRNFKEYEEKRPQAIRISQNKQFEWVLDTESSNEGNEEAAQNGQANQLEDPSSPSSPSSSEHNEQS